jgi:glycosyltransferase involved in cell wall biosynthesis
MMLATNLIPVPVKLFTTHNQAEYTLNYRRLNVWMHKLAFSLLGYTPVAICHNIAKSWQEACGIRPERMEKVHNGVDTLRFVPAKKVNVEPQIPIITVGRMDQKKNHMGLLDAFSRLYQTNPNVRLTIVGDGVLRPELERKVRELGLAEVVSMPGVQKDVCSYLQKADLYVSASEAEGLPLSILEAMACGLPVVATDVGGTSEIVHDGENGIVVPKGDPVALEKALEKMVADARMRKEFGEASLRIVQDWSIEACVRGYERLYAHNNKNSRIKGCDHG